MWVHRAVLIFIFCSPQPDTNETMDMGLMHYVVCLFQLLLVLI